MLECYRDCRMGDCQLDDLLDMLEDEDDEAFATNDVVKDQKTESVSSEKSKQSSSSSCSEAAADPEKVEMAAKLAEMEEQVKTFVLNQ